MMPQPNKNMNQPNRRPALPMGMPSNQPGSANQNGQGPDASQQSESAPPPQSQMRYGQPQSGFQPQPMSSQTAAGFGMPSGSGQPAHPDGSLGSMMGIGTPGDAPPPMPAPPSQMNPSTPSPQYQGIGAPPVARQATSGPMPPPQPYQRQQMNPEQKMQRRIQPPVGK